MQPGTNARVNQKFNRLEVVFSTPAGRVTSAANNSNASSTRSDSTGSLTAESRDDSSASSRSNGTESFENSSTARGANNAAARKNSGGEAAAVATGPNATATPGDSVAQPTENTFAATQPAATPPPDQIAQAQTQTPNTSTQSGTTNTSSSWSTSTLGATLARNWLPLLILAALLLIGVGLILAARSKARRHTPLRAESDARPAFARTTLKARPIVAAPAQAETDSVPANVAQSEASAVSAQADMTAASAQPEEFAAAQLADDVDAPHVAESNVIESSIVGAHAQDAGSHSAALPLAATALTAAVIAAPLVAGQSHADEPSAAAPVDQSFDEHGIDAHQEPAQKEAGAQMIAPVLAASEVEMSSRSDAHRAQDEVEKLLAGLPYDESVIGSDDVAMRQLVAAELLSAIDRSPSRQRTRASAAFFNHDYFDEATRELRTADAPAARAAAAHSLGVVKDKTATPHLSAALEDDSPEVRRAALLALSEVRDAEAVPALQAMFDRERDPKVPRALIRNAIEACSIGEGFMTFVPGNTQAPEQTQAPTLEESATPVASAPAPTRPEDDLPIELEPVSYAQEKAAPVGDEILEAELFETNAADSLVRDSSAVNAEPFTFEPVEVNAIEAQPVIGEPVVADAPLVAEASIAGPVEPEPAIAAAPAPLTAETPAVVADNAAMLDDEFLLDLPDITTAPSVVAEAVRPAQSVVNAQVSQPEVVEHTREAEAVPPPHAVEAEIVEAAVLHAESNTELERQATLEPQAATTAELHEPSAFTPASTVAPVENFVGSDQLHASEWVDVEVYNHEFDEHLRPIAPAPAAQVAATEPSAFIENSFERVAPEGLTEQPPVLEAGVPLVHHSESFEPVVSEVVREFPGGVKAIEPSVLDKGIMPVNADESTIPVEVLNRLYSDEPQERVGALGELARLGDEDSFREISRAFDDPVVEVRDGAAHALYDFNTDRAASFTRALREGTPERRRRIGAALSSSGIAGDAISALVGESREKTYDAFSLLFLMSKAGEVQPLLRAIKDHPNNEVRLAVIRLLALSGQQEVLPAFRRLAVRGSLPTEVRSAVMEAIFQLSSQVNADASSAA